MKDGAVSTPPHPTSPLPHPESARRRRRRSESAHPGHRTRPTAVVRNGDNGHNGAHASNDDGLLERLKYISISEQQARQQQVTCRSHSNLLASQYQLMFRPMPIGMRMKLWEEGMKYREQRKKSGFNHFKLEWKRYIIRTTRTVKLLMFRHKYKSPRLEINGEGAKKRRKASGRRKGGVDDFDGEFEDEDEDERRKRLEAELEHLDLPPTKLHMKQLKLLRRYASKQEIVQNPEEKDKNKKTKPSTKQGEDDEGSKALRPLTSYERNKQNNMKSNIVLPTSTSSSDNSIQDIDNIINGDDGKDGPPSTIKSAPVVDKDTAPNPTISPPVADTSSTKMVDEETQVTDSLMAMAGTSGEGGGGSVSKRTSRQRVVRPRWRPPGGTSSSPRKYPYRSLN